LLAVFYAGAVLASGRSWLAVWRGRIRFSELRDVTGIGDRAMLRRLFGLTCPAGYYRVTLEEVLQRRRAAGMILTNLPVHLMFLAALAWALLGPGGPAVTAIAWAACAHATVIATVALTVLAGSRWALSD
jgi:hypothetical protein